MLSKVYNKKTIYMEAWDQEIYSFCGLRFEF